MLDVVIIHRPSRTDRSENVERLHNIFPQATVQQAAEPVWEKDPMVRAVRGCSVSHLLAVRNHLRHKPLLVLEDDAILDGKVNFHDFPKDAAVILYGTEVGIYGDSINGYREVLSNFNGSHAVLYMPILNQTSALVDAALIAASHTFGGHVGSMAFEGLLRRAVSGTPLKIYRPDRVPFVTMESVSDTFGVMAPSRTHYLVAEDRKPILPPETWESVFGPWSGKRAHLLHVGGNQGDLLINAATRQLFNYYSISEVPIEASEVVFYPGGASIAGRYGFRDSHWAFHTTSLPKVSLPQSWERPDSYGELADVVWVRDHESLKHCPRAKFAHDLALGYTPPKWPVNTNPIEKGVFFRTDVEKSEIPTQNISDPCAGLPQSHLHYLLRASSYNEIHTNRLHFAIAGLTVGVKTTLYPNDYHKCRSVWESSLRDLGCLWSDKFKV